MLLLTFAATCVNLVSVIHLLIEQKLREEQDIPHAEDRQHEQRPGGEQRKNRQIAQLQNSHAQDAPEIFYRKQQTVSQPNGRPLPEQYQLRPIEGIDNQHHQQGKRYIATVPSDGDRSAHQNSMVINVQTPENNPSSAPGIRLLFQFCFQDRL